MEASVLGLGTTLWPLAHGFILMDDPLPQFWGKKSRRPCFNLVLILKIIYPVTYSSVNRENMFCHLPPKEPRPTVGCDPLRACPPF